MTAIHIEGEIDPRDAYPAMTGERGAAGSHHSDEFKSRVVAYRGRLSASKTAFALRTTRGTVIGIWNREKHRTARASA